MYVTRRRRPVSAKTPYSWNWFFVTITLIHNPTIRVEKTSRRRYKNTSLVNAGAVHNRVKRSWSCYWTKFLFLWSYVDGASSQSRIHTSSQGRGQEMVKGGGGSGLQAPRNHLRFFRGTENNK